MLLFCSNNLVGYLVQGDASNALMIAIGKRNFNLAMDEIDLLSRSHSNPDPTLPVINEAFLDLPEQAVLVQSLSQNGQGQDRLRLHLSHCADLTVSEMASFIENPHDAFSITFVDALLDQLCAIPSPKRRGCCLPARVWDMMLSADVATQTRLGRLIHGATSHRQSGAVFLIVPLFVSDATWVLVVANFTGSVSILTPHAVNFPSSGLRSVRHFLSIHMKVSILTLEVKALPENCLQTQLELIWSTVLLFGEPLHSTLDQHLESLARFNKFNRAVLLFLLGLSNSIFDML